MKRLFGYSLLVCFLAACGVQSLPTTTSDIEPQATIWQQVGDFPSSSHNFAVARDSQDNIYIASTGANNSLHVHTFDGTQWIQLGEAIGLVQVQQQPQPFSLAVGNDNKPVVAWMQNYDEMYVARWNGTAWEKVGDNILIRDYGSNPSIVIDRNNHPIVAWTEMGDIYVKRWDGETWVQLSGALDIVARNETRHPAIAVGRDGKPFVAWFESNALYVKSWTGSKWILLGGSVTTVLSDWTSRPSIAIDREGKPIITWQDWSGDENVYVKRWDGTTWVQMGEHLDIDLSNYVNTVSLTIGSNGKPVMSWHEYGPSPYSPNDSNIYVKRWDGISWVRLGLPVNGSAFSGLDIATTVLRNNAPVVVWWGENFETSETGIFVHKRVGDQWLQRGEEVNPDWLPAQNAVLALRNVNRPTIAYEMGRDEIVVTSWIDGKYRWGGGISLYGTSPSLAVLKNSSPVVAYSERDTTNSIPGKIYVKYATMLNVDDYGFWDWQWAQFGEALNTNLENEAQFPSIKIGTDNRAVVAWQENDGTSWDVHVKRWNGSTWIQLGDALDISLTANAQHPVVAIGTDNHPVIAWYEETATTARVYVKRWDGSQWIQVGKSLNVSNLQKAYLPSLVLESTDTPIVSWQETTATSKNVYVKRWDGTAWVRLGTVVDISSSANAENPSLQIGFDNSPVVAWQEAGNIYVKRWDGTAWVQISGALDTVLANAASNPSLVLRGDGKPIVAWDETDGNSSNIYVKRY
jgi:hypothetical protein